MSYPAYLDALSHNADTVNAAVELLLPYYSAGLGVAWMFGPYFAAFAGAYACGKLLFRQATGAELIRPIATLLVFLFCLIPVQPSFSGLPSTIGLGPYVLYWGSQNFNMIVQGQVKRAQDMVTNGNPVPIGALGAMNKSYAQIFEGTDLQPLLEDYWGNCTNDVVDFRNLTTQHFRSVGLLGPGALGLMDDDTTNGQDILANASQMVPPGGDPSGLGNFFRDQLDAMVGSPPSVHALRAEVMPLLARKSFPQGTRGYRIPTRDFWEYTTTGEQGPGGSDPYLKIDHSQPGDISEAELRMMSIPDRIHYMQNGSVAPGWYDRQQVFHASNCAELFQLSHVAVREYYLGIKDQFAVPNQDDPEMDFGEFSATVSTNAVNSALETLYSNSSAIDSNATRKNYPTNGLKPTGEILDEIGSAAVIAGQGAVHFISSFLLGLNLDQWVLAMIGSMALGVAFLIMIFPFVAPFAFFSPRGDNAIVNIFKAILMLQLTLSFSYVIVSLGATVMAVVNAYAVADLLNTRSMSTTGLAGLAIAINTACLIFPIFAGKLAHMLIFGSAQVGPASGQTVSAGQQAKIAGGAAYITNRIVNGLPDRKPRSHYPDLGPRGMSGGPQGPAGSPGSPGMPAVYRSSFPASPGSGRYSGFRRPNGSSPSGGSPGLRHSPLALPPAQGRLTDQRNRKPPTENGDDNG